jgi:hypothetical protein
MHVPDINRALLELIRVAKPGGYLVFEEINSRSPEALLMRIYWKLFKGKRIRATKTPAGVEHTSEFAGEMLFWRHIDPRWLIERLASHSCISTERGCSMFSELYQYLPTYILKSIVYNFNICWIQFVNRPNLSYHNIFVFRKN